MVWQKVIPELFLEIGTDYLRTWMQHLRGQTVELISSGGQNIGDLQINKWTKDIQSPSARVLMEYPTL